MNCIDYSPDMGQINLTDDMAAVLKGLPIDEQAKWFGIVYDEREEEYSYGEAEGTRKASYGTDVDKCSYARKWIVQDGMIVGIVFRNRNNSDAYCFLNEWCNTYFCIDDDGTGSTDVSVSCKLVWRG